jgi:hypothetical protein
VQSLDLLLGFLEPLVQLSEGFGKRGQSFGEELGRRVLGGPCDVAKFVAWR